MKKTWPLNPITITKNDNYEGILDEETLKGLIIIIAANISQPIAFVEFKSGKSNYANIINIDNNTSCHHNESCVELKKDKLNKGYCSKCDNLHINLLRDIYKHNFEEEINKRINSKKFISDCETHFEKKSNVKIVIFNNSHFYLEYNCLVLGYKELLFPVFFENKVIGLIFVGEVVLKDELSIINNNFIKFISHVSKFNEDKTIITLHKKRVSDNTLNEIQYKKLIESCIDQVNKFEMNLIDRMSKRREHFLTKTFEAFRNSIYNELNEYFLKEAIDEKKSIQKLEKFWEIVNKHLQELKQIFPIKHIVFFAHKNFTQKPKEELEIVASVDLPEKYNSYRYFIKNLNSAAIDKEIFSYNENGNNLLSNLRDTKKDIIDIDFDTDYIRVLPSLVTDKGIIVIWIRHDNEKWPRIKDKLYGKEGNHDEDKFDEKSGILLSYISSVYASIYANIASNLIEMILKSINHEVGQIVPGFNSIRMQYFDGIKVLASKDNININRSLEDLTKQLHFIGENTIKIILDKIVPRKYLFWVFEELIYKWENSYTLDTLKKKVKIISYKSTKEDTFRPQIYADKTLLEQILFNLLNNAVKYCYLGTNIWIDCKKDNDYSESPHKLIVENYGMELNEKEDIYKLFKRGNVHNIPGLGIGLYLIKKIAESHGGKVYHKSILISTYNVPLIDCYLSFPMKEENIDQYNKIKNEKTKLENDNIFKRIISGINDEDNKFEQLYYPTEDEVYDLINIPTYKIVFTVEIPSK